ncbi:malto-oligosyltrehalose trehalohydrolase [Pedobacter rhodius]|uniref:Malto-oligosyltrehalose trehalohydrolase n=1 Tax=Pedobacter rhodius TaxID=3004098 RepID=A0ABT4KUE3_9SPHI|nr:malto-oligosyltrehalose trehalohydrolase [Pedobacter sp. SJ11]MCZ4222385.1 malto-oligosyltrehalose trehalohydrolase [Pedobacter sp. SJ11]
MQINIERRKIGLNFNEEGLAEIWLWAPDFLTILIHVKKLKHSLEMSKQELGYWFLQTDKISPLDEYSFELIPIPEKQEYTKKKSQTWADPASLLQNNGVSGPSNAFDLKAFKWTDQNWKGIELKDFIIYELHTGTFTADGNFSSIINKLDYLVDLGITAIEIMPVAQFPGNRNWGYDGVYPFAVQNTYGGPNALQQLVNSCHQKGIAVILDVVYNHFGPEGNSFTEFGPYFTDKYHTPWGSAINYDDAGCDAVRTFFIENALMWFRDFHVDALRLDAVHAIKDFSPIHILSEIKTYTQKLSEFTGKPYKLIAELDLNDNRFINSQLQGGYGMDGQWIDEFHHALRVSAGQEQTGYYADFNGVEHLAKSYNDAYVYDGQYSAHRQRKFGLPAKNNPGEQFIVFSQNHDQVGNRMLGERTSTLVSFEMMKLMAGAVFCAPFLPLIFMGEEWAETNPFQFFISHSDQELIEAVRKGRKAEFAAFHNEQETPDPQAESTFNQSKLDWTKTVPGKHKIMHSYYKKLIRLRKENPVLNTLDRINTHAEALTDQKIVLLKRNGKSQHLIIVLNFSNKKQNIPAADFTGHWLLLMDSAVPEFTGQNQHHIVANGQINISPESILIFSKTDE